MLFYSIMYDVSQRGQYLVDISSLRLLINFHPFTLISYFMTNDRPKLGNYLNSNKQFSN